MLSLVYASWNFYGDTPISRRTDGAPVDLDGIKDASLTKMKEISPESGDLESVIQFVNDFSAMYLNLFSYTGYFPREFSLYNGAANRFSLELSNPHESKTFMASPFITSDVIVDTDLNVINPEGSDQEYEQRNTTSTTRGSTLDWTELATFLLAFNITDSYRVTFAVYRGGDQIRDEQTKAFTEFITENIQNVPEPGTPNYSEDPPNQIENLIEPIYVDFQQTLYDNIRAELRSYHSERTSMSSDGDGITPDEKFVEMRSTMESNFEDIKAAMCDRRQYDKTVRHRGSNVRTRIFFNLVEQDLETYFATLIYNYYVYSYYVDRTDALSLKDFMNHMCGSGTVT